MSQGFPRIAGDVDSDLYRRTVAAVVRTAVLLTVLIAFCAGSWVV